MISSPLSLPDVSVTREFLMAQRQALLLQLEAIEQLLAIAPRTSELRKAAKAERKLDETVTKRDNA